jgi:hypothetical protein
MHPNDRSFVVVRSSVQRTCRLHKPRHWDIREAVTLAASRGHMNRLQVSVVVGLGLAGRVVLVLPAGHERFSRADGAKDVAQWP